MADANFGKVYCPLCGWDVDDGLAFLDEAEEYPYCPGCGYEWPVAVDVRLVDEPPVCDNAGEVRDEIE